MTAARDPGLQPERTELAWRRTLLALAVGSLISIRVLLPVLGDWALATGAGGVLVAVLLWVLVRRRHRAVALVFEGRLPAAALPGGGVLLALTCVTAVGAAAGVLSAVLPQR